ncbi:MAG: MG2 domain-containing protein [Salibacteraceae bacterium]
MHFTRTTLSLIGLLSLLFVFGSCNRNRSRAPEIDPAFGSYITAFSSGVIPAKSSIRIRLTSDYPKPVKPGEELDADLFDFTPSVSGTARWVDQRTIEYTPNKPLKHGQTYDVDFQLDELLEVPEALQTFSFQFKTMDQGFKVYLDGLKEYSAEESEWQKLTGRVVTFDEADSMAVEKLMQASQDQKNLSIRWNHHHGNTHYFTVDSIARREKKGQMLVEWDGDALGLGNSSKREIEVPALGEFKITQVQVVQQPEQYVRVSFSDPLLPKQSLEGKLFLLNEYNVTYAIEGNHVTLYPQSRLSGQFNLVVTEQVKNAKGYTLPEEEERTLNFEELKPDFRMVGKGAILPKTQGLLFPFEAVGLTAVDVFITQIYEDNVQQFLQVNNLEGVWQLERVGHHLAKKRIHLGERNSPELQEWQHYSIKLDELIDVQPGVIYRVELRCRKEYAAYSACEPTANTDLQTLEIKSDGGSWPNSRYRQDDYWNDFNYDYREHDTPCHDKYYRHRSRARNILASDLGIIAKMGADRKVHVITNDLLSTQPKAGVAIEFYNYQQRHIATGTTNAEGMLTQELPEKPFLIVASKGSQKGYLKMEDGRSLSLSKFDVSGAQVREGIKGLIYGERGVWRPGDSLFLTFMMEDADQLLPKNHPIAFSLYDPRGRLVHKKIETRSVNGMYDFRTTTDAEAPTGNYRAIVKVGNRTYTKYLKVETVKPNRLKIYLDFGKDLVAAEDDEVVGKLQVKWLHGAIARNLKAKVDLTVNQMRTRFKGFKKYHFDDPIRSLYSEEETIFEDRLDEKGEASLDPVIAYGKNAPGMLKALFTTKVFEEGGGFSIDRFSINYSPFSHYVGIKVPKGSMYRGTLVTDEDHTIEVATVDQFGKKASRKGLQVKVYQLNWRWWWDSYGENMANYIARSSTRMILDTLVNTKEGKGQFKLRINRPKWGRFLVRVTDPQSGHSCGKIVYIDWPYWARANRTVNEFATMLNFSSDKEKYSVGEAVKVTFPSSTKGRALVCVENGSRILKKFWVETEQGETRFEVPTTSEMAPNVFVHVSLLQPHQETANDLPIRLYGVIPVLVEDPLSHLQPEIITQKVWRPETKVKVQVKEKEGRNMTYTLAVVDEGLLDLTRFSTPDPWKHFYAKEALGVRTWDLYDQVMGAYGGELNKILSVGGDGENGPAKKQKANRFKPMVRFVGPFELKAGKTGTHTIDVPNYVGSVRVMVVARQEEAYGHTDATVAVRKPLMVLATLPRVLGPGETVQLPVNVFAMEKQVKNVQIAVETNQMLQSQGNTTANIQFDAVGDQVVNFELKVPKKVGIGKVKVQVSSGKETAYHEIEIDVRSPNPPVMNVLETVIQPGESWEAPFGFTGVSGTEKGTMEISTMPAIDLGRRLKYLIGYPHGCLEQTTSRAFPQLYLADVLHLNNDFREEIDFNIRAALQKLSNFQQSEGSFTYWPGESYYSSWGTNYAGHFMLEAERLGYALPDGMKSTWIQAQKRLSREWTAKWSYRSGYYSYRSAVITQAYRLFTLALANSPELGAMNRLREEASLSLQARWRLAAAYHLAGQPEVAKELVASYDFKIDDYIELSYSYGCRYRDEGMILEALCLMGDETNAAVLAKTVASHLSSRRWLNTQATSFCLIGISRFLGSVPITENMRYTYRLGQQSEQHENRQSVLHQQALPQKLVADSSQLTITNDGKGILYVRLLMEGVPITGDQSRAANNLSIDIDYETMDGEPLDPSRIEQGTDFAAVVTVRNPGVRGHLADMALTQVFPSGWEIHNDRMDLGVRNTDANSHYQYRDIRDDRINTYFWLESHHSVQYRVRLNATYKGRFYMPTIMAESMYDRTINAREPGQWVEVIDSGG